MQSMRASLQNLEAKYILKLVSLTTTSPPGVQANMLSPWVTAKPPEASLAQFSPTYLIYTGASETLKMLT